MGRLKNSSSESSATCLPWPRIFRLQRGLIVGSGRLFEILKRLGASDELASRQHRHPAASTPTPVPGQPQRPTDRCRNRFFDRCISQVSGSELASIMFCSARREQAQDSPLQTTLFLPHHFQEPGTGLYLLLVMSSWEPLRSSDWSRSTTASRINSSHRSSLTALQPGADTHKVQPLLAWRRAPFRRAVQLTCRLVPRSPTQATLRVGYAFVKLPHARVRSRHRG
jgi:hypothetical protein